MTIPMYQFGYDRSDKMSALDKARESWKYLGGTDPRIAGITPASDRPSWEGSPVARGGMGTTTQSTFNETMRQFIAAGRIHKIRSKVQHMIQARGDAREVLDMCERSPHAGGILPHVMDLWEG